MQIFMRFSKAFFRAIWRVRGVVLALIALVVADAAVIVSVEKIAFGDALYFAFVTGLTIGYGDIVMHTPAGRLLALLIGLVGILFTGLIVAVAVHALRESMKEY
jgi:hypothetical protein